MFIYNTNESNILSISHCSHQSPKDSVYHRHLHENHELLLVIKGDINYNIDGMSYMLAPYDLLFIPSSTYHFVIPTSNDTYENYVVNFCPYFTNEERLKKLFNPPHIANITHDTALRRMFSLFDYYYETYSLSDFAEASDHLLNEILLLSSYKSQTDDAHRIISDHSLIPMITSYIAKNLESDLNADIIAQKLNFSKSYVKNQFSEIMGIGIQQYINQKRIHAAHNDIQNGLSAQEVAIKYCYQDYSSFFRQYKKVFGVSPQKNKH